MRDRPAMRRLNTHLLIHEVTAKKPCSPDEQRVAALKSHLNHARAAAQTQRLAELSGPIEQAAGHVEQIFGAIKNPHLLSGGF
jgi:hypothetical protein